MLKQEAVWLGEKLSNISESKIGKILNVGSSTYLFRTQYQPYIDSEIFLPLKKRGVPVIHLDMKNEVGVDLVGDLEDKSFLESLKKERYNTVFCSNFLEHVEDRGKICSILNQIVPTEGILILTVPYLYPYHKDPIDSLYRPTIDALAQAFPDFSVMESDIVIDSENLFTLCLKKPKTGLRHIFYFCNVFSRDWIKYMRYLPFLFSRFQVTCLILQKK